MRKGTDEAAASAKRFRTAGRGVTGILGDWRVKMMAVMFGFRFVKRTIGDVIQASTDYIENLNLFHISMGEFAEEAQDYAEKVESMMGIDSSEWMKHQGVIKQIASGLGIAARSP